MASGKTLYERDTGKPLGFFPQLYENVVKSLGEDGCGRMEEEYAKSTEHLIKFTYEIESFKRNLIIRDSFQPKNGYECKAKKDYGNKAYQNGKDLDALYLYTQAVISAPCDEVTWEGKDLAVSLANRSAVLFALKAYALALDDIKLALDSGYPKELRYKLLERKMRILNFYQQFYDARETCKELLKSLDQATKLEINKKLKLQKDAQQMMKFLENNPKGLKNDPSVQIRPPPDMCKVEDKNPKYPALSNCIAFRYQKGRGRYAVAARDIQVGEFICVEKPIASRILPEYMASNCSMCFKSMKAPLPCPVCTKAMFCSLDCRTLALQTSHKYECKSAEFLAASGMSIICYLAFRAVTQKPLEFFLKNKQRFKEHDETSGSDAAKVNKYVSDDYTNLLNLVRHHEERKMGDIFHRAMLCVMLLRVLKKYGYFGEDRAKDLEEGPDSLSEDEQYIGSLLNHLLESLQFNSHEVAQFEMIAKNTEEGASSTFIGAGIYPTLALFNHSCDPSIVRFYVEDTVAVQAIKNIKRGEEVCENYGPIFFHSSKDDRQKQLKTQYWFECQCIACKEDWPMMHEFNDESLNFRCQVCDDKVTFNVASSNPLLRCACGTPVEMLKALKAIGDTDKISEKAKDALRNGHLVEAQKLYSDYLTTLDKHLCPPYADYYKIQQSIWKCIWMRYGNRVIKSKMRKPAEAAPASDDFDVVD